MVLQHSKVLSGILSVYKYSILCKVSLHLQSNQQEIMAINDKDVY